MSMFDDIPVDVGVIYEGERIRKDNMQVELGGPKQAVKFELVRAKKMNEVEDKKVTVVGPDLKDLPEGSSVPF
ncbi:MAG: CO dehydrogenase/CO-methylating acetyl-CoA synthase complex subunit beta, partial [Candidatus Bathyarchaeia archaeon]